MNTVTHLDMKRSIIWTFQAPESEKFCRLLTELYLWINDGNIAKISDERIRKDLMGVVNRHNSTSEDLYRIKEIRVLQRNKVDDLII